MPGPAPSPPVRLGILGCGFVAREIHVPRLSQLDDLYEVVGVSDLNLAAAHDVAERLGGVPCFADADELISESSCEALAVLTPIHGEPVRTALEHDLDVFVEKPLCEVPAEARALATLADRRGRVVMVGTMRRFDEGLALGRRLLPMLGDIRWVRIIDFMSEGASAAAHGGDLRDPVLQDRLREAGIESPQALNATQTALLMMIHDISIVDELIGVESCLDAVAAPDGWSVTGRLELVGSLPCVFSVAEFGLPRFPVFVQRVEVTGTVGTLEIAFSDPTDPKLSTTVRLTGGGPGEADSIPEPSEVDGGSRIWNMTSDAYDREWRAFHAGVRNRSLPTGGIDRAVKEVELAWKVATLGTTP